MKRSIVHAAALAGLLMAWSAHAHQAPSGWEYDRDCCDNKDCAQVGDGAVTEVEGGFRVYLPPGSHPFVSGRTVDVFIPHQGPDGRLNPKIRPSGDEFRHACVAPWGHVYCIYIPPGGV